MTREEALNTLMKMRAWREWGKEQKEEERPEMPEQKEVDEAFDVCIKLLQSSLPSNLDDATEDCIQGLIPEAELPATTPFALEYVIEMLYKTFKAGAEWMAGQGGSVMATVIKYNDINILSYDQEFAPVVQRLNYGDRVVVQVRKK